MNTERAIRLLAGILVLTGTALGYWLDPWFLVLPAFVGFNLAQSSLTGICPAEWIFKACGMPSCGAVCGSAFRKRDTESTEDRGRRALERQAS